MKTQIAVGLAALATTGLMASPTYAGSTARTASVAPCSITNSTLDGGPAVTYCGPATATLTVGGKTYTFKDGYCQSIGVSSIKLDLTLGTLAEGKSGAGASGNAGKPSFRMDLAGTYTSIIDEAFWGGKKLSSLSGVSYKGSLKTKGTFKASSGKFSGSWNCHGVFVKS